MGKYWNSKLCIEQLTICTSVSAENDPNLYSSYTRSQQFWAKANKYEQWPLRGQSGLILFPRWFRFTFSPSLPSGGRVKILKCFAIHNWLPIRSDGWSEHSKMFEINILWSTIKCLMIDNCSDGWTTDDLKYQWKTVDPVQITKDLHLPRSSFHADGFKIVRLM